MKLPNRLIVIIMANRIFPRVDCIKPIATSAIELIYQSKNNIKIKTEIEMVTTFVLVVIDVRL